MKSLITRTGLMAMVCLMAYPSLAQSDSTAQDTIVEEEIIVEEIDVEREIEIAEEEVERALEEVELAEEEVERAMEEVEEEVERAMEEVEEALEDLDIQIIGLDSPVLDSNDRVIYKDKKIKVIMKHKDSTLGDGPHMVLELDDHKHKKPRYKLVETDWFNMQLGFNQMLNSNNELELPLGYENMTLHNVNSFDFHLHFVQQALRIYRDNIRISYGIGIDFNNYSYTKDVVLNKDVNGVLQANLDPNRQFTKNKLATQYLTMPLMLNFKIGDRGRKKFKIAAGANFGYLINSYQRLKWQDQGKQSSRVKDDFNLQRLRMGYELQFGYGSINLYAKYFPESMFKTDKGPDARTVSVGFLIGTI